MQCMPFIYLDTKYIFARIWPKMFNFSPRHLARVTDVEATDTSNHNLNYGLVVDCGSSGSRVFVYCWPRHNGNPHDLLDIRQMRDQHRKPVVMKIKPGEAYQVADDWCAAGNRHMHTFSLFFHNVEDIDF